MVVMKKKKAQKNQVNVMNNVDWDKWQLQVDEHNSDCPWTDDEDEMAERDKAEWKADEEED